MLLQVAFAAGVAFAAVFWTADAHACHETTVCMSWRAYFFDSGVGEDFLLPDFDDGDPTTPDTSSVRASGARILLIPPAPEQPISTSLNEFGCVTFETQFSFGHKMLVYADAVVEGVRLRPSLGTAVPNEPTFQDYFWEVHLGGLGVGSSAFGYIDMENQVDSSDSQARIIPIMAAVTATLKRFAELDAMPPNLAADETLILHYTPGYGNARCNCTGLSTSRLEIGADSYREKFVVAHELGHWLHARWAGGVGAYGYAYPAMNEQPEDAPCQFDIVDPVDDNMTPLLQQDGNSHGLRSAEFSGGGLVEGIAHFLASAAFNDASSSSGTFRYYKDIDEEYAGEGYYKDLIDGNYLVALAGGGPGTVGGESHWVESKCPNDWASGGPTDEVSSGMDWMRFWWRFLSAPVNPPDSKPTLSQILTFLAVVNATDPWAFNQVTPQLSDAVALPASALNAHEARFHILAIEEGVFNDE